MAASKTERTRAKSHYDIIAAMLNCSHREKQSRRRPRAGAEDAAATAPHLPGSEESLAAPAELESAIDHGLTSDKVPGLDPAAAPLGTDAEAAGTRIPGAVVQADLELECSRPAPKLSQSQAPHYENSIAPDAGRFRGRRSDWLIPTLTGSFVGLVTALVVLAVSG